MSFPEEGKPIDFGGAVGDFTLAVSTSKSELNASESLQAIVEVKGEGNLKLFSLPDLSTPSALERYDPEYSEQVNTTLSGMRGSIKNAYTLVPQFQGKYPIPPVSFSYFDPVTKAYKKLTSEELIVDVLEGPQASSSAPSIPSNTKASTPATTASFQFIAQRTKFTPIVQPSFLGSKWFYILMLLPLALLALFVLFRQYKPDAALAAQKKKARLVKKFLGDAKRSMSESNSFYIALELALHNYLKVRLQIQTNEFSKEKIKALLSKKGVDAETADLFIHVLTNCELARYTPSTRNSMEQDYQSAVAAITQMDKQI